MPQNQEFEDIYSNSSENQKIHGKKKKSRWKKILVAVISVLLVLTGGLFCLAWYFLGDLNIDTEFPKSDSELGVVSKEEQDDSITNIALYGIDSRTHDDQGHADATMILSVDKKHNKLKPDFNLT